MDDPLSEFQEGQWWVTELDKAAGSVGAADDFKRAVAVVHHMLRSAADALAQPAAEPVAWQERQGRRINKATGEVTQWSGWYECKDRSLSDPLAYTAPDDLIPREWRPLYTHPAPAAEPRNQSLLDLLAIIHRDGGHHTAEVGLDQSVKDAHERWGQLIQAAESGSLKTP